jgi:stage III sporulation protein AE
MYGYTAYMTVTGVISGSVDASALKATKLAISSAVPVIGGLLSDASETILVGAGVMKNTVGIYGLFVVISLFIGPFLKIGVQYLLMKITNAVTGVFASKQIVELLNDFTETMGMILSMIGVQTLLLIVSTVCFMRGVT